MAHKLERGERFLKCIYEEIIIAVAVVVIRNKPKNLSIEEYIEFLRSSSNISEIFERQARSLTYIDASPSHLLHQQELLFNKLWAVIPKSPETAFEKLRSDDIDLSPDLFDSEPKDIEENDLNADEEADSNMRFIQAIVRLKYLIESCSSLPAYKFQELLELYLPHDELGENVSKDTKSVMNESISCCSLRYVMKSSDTNKLLYHAVQNILSYIGKNIKSSLWDGDDETTLIYHAIKTVKQVIEFVSSRYDTMGNCLEACSKFIAGLINDLKNDKEINKSEIYERQCMLIIELGKSGYLCVKAISVILETLFDMSLNLERNLINEHKLINECSCGPPFDENFLENSCYLLYIAKVLLKFYNSEWRDQHTKLYKVNSGTEVSDIRRVRDLWRSSWKLSESVPVDDDDFQNSPCFDETMITKLKEQLNHYVKVFSQHYSLFAIDLFECEKLLIK